MTRLSLDGAACRGDDLFVFFDEQSLEQARTRCDTCPVRASCYLTGIAGDNHGVWGGVWMNGTVRRRTLRDAYLRQVVLEARMLLLEQFGILVQHSPDVERTLKRIVKSLT